jgi:hypothetical protein
MRDVRRQTVADDDRDIAGAGESLADEALLAPIACLERAAVDREDHRCVAGAVGNIDVEAILAVAIIGICDVVDIADDLQRGPAGTRPHRRLCCRRNDRKHQHYRGRERRRDQACGMLHTLLH